MPPTGCWPACPSSCRLSSRCLSPACRFAISLPDICPHPVCVPAAHPFGLSSPPSLHSIHNKMPTKKHQTECYKSEEKHCLSICLLSMSACRLTACGLPARVPAAYLPGAKNPPPYVSRLNITKKLSDSKNWGHFLLKKNALKSFCPYNFFEIPLSKKVRPHYISWADQTSIKKHRISEIEVIFS